MESRFYSLLRLLFLLNFLALNRASQNGGPGVIKVNYKFAGADATLSALRAHDDIRHLSILSGVDLPLGGTGRPDAVGCALFPFLFVFSIFASFPVFTAFSFLIRRVMGSCARYLWNCDLHTMPKFLCLIVLVSIFQFMFLRCY